MLAPSQPQGAVLCFVQLAQPRNPATRERFAPSHRPLRAVPYGLPLPFCLFHCRLLMSPVAAPSPSLARFRSGADAGPSPSEAPPAGRHHTRACFVQGDYTKPSDIPSQTYL